MTSLSAVPALQPTPVREPRFRPVHFQTAAVALIALPLFYGTVRAFPMYDDGWLQLLTKESGAAILSQTMPDRPLMALLCRLVYSLFPTAAGLAGVSLALWCVLAFQAGQIWKRVFPALDGYAATVSCLTLAPVVVHTQFCTILVSVPCVLPAVLVYGALLCALRFASPRARLRGPALACASVMLMLGILISEYAVAASLASLAIFALLLRQPFGGWRPRRLRAVVVLFSAITAISYLVYLRLTNLAYRPDVSPLQAGLTVRRNPVGAVANLITGIWHAVVGAYAGAAGSAGIYWDSPSTIVGVVCGGLVGLALCLALRGTEKTATLRRITPQDLVGLLAALLAALAPVVLMGRATTAPGFASRFLTPALPAAAVLTVLLALTLFRRSMMWVPVAMLGVTGGYAAVTQASAAVHQRDFAVAAGERLRPYVAADDGYTVAVLSIHGMDYEFTARATANWPRELEKRAWIYDSDTGIRIFGPRTQCANAPRIHHDLRLLTREGPVSRLLWIDVRDERIAAIEPYCRSAEPIR